jgi:hypothetical protein
MLLRGTAVSEITNSNNLASHATPLTIAPRGATLAMDCARGHFAAALNRSCPHKRRRLAESTG